MDLSLFNYPFPKELVAQHPLPRRDDSRMMVVDRKTRSWSHRRFPDLAEYLREGDLLILNNAEADLVPVEGRLVPPLPPYIKRKKGSDFTEEDYQRYRTVYAEVPGSKAAPTAGFHFTEEMLEKIRSMGVEIRFLTLHVGFDTFKPIRTPQTEDHLMHGETYEIPNETLESVIRTKKEGRRVIAVGTTVVRTLESWAIAIQAPGAIPSELAPSRSIRPSDSFSLPPARTLLKDTPGACSTHLFIYSGFQFQIVDALLTNFHRPRSTVLVMVSAFAGRELILSAYAEAIRERYRLFSYGDCMLIL